MADKIKSSYKFSKSFYDDAITQGKWWSKLYFKLLWGGVDDNEIARRVLSWIPDDFKGKMLDVPVGTAVFTTEKYKRMKQADITCLDYSQDMLEQALVVAEQFERTEFIHQYIKQYEHYIKQFQQN